MHYHDILSINLATQGYHSFILISLLSDEIKQIRPLVREDVYMHDKKISFLIFFFFDQLIIK